MFIFFKPRSHSLSRGQNRFGVQRGRVTFSQNHKCTKSSFMQICGQLVHCRLIYSTTLRWDCLFYCSLGCIKIIFFSRIEPVFLYGMCIGHTRSHAKFQTSSLNDLAWPPLFVNGSWPSRKSFKMTWKLNVWPCHIEGHQKCSPKWNNTWCFRLLEVC